MVSAPIVFSCSLLFQAVVLNPAASFAQQVIAFTEQATIRGDHLRRIIDAVVVHREIRDLG